MLFKPLSAADIAGLYRSHVTLHKQVLQLHAWWSVCVIFVYYDELWSKNCIFTKVSV